MKRHILSLVVVSTALGACDQAKPSPEAVVSNIRVAEMDSAEEASVAPSPAEVPEVVVASGDAVGESGPTADDLAETRLEVKGDSAGNLQDALDTDKAGSAALAGLGVGLHGAGVGGGGAAGVVGLGKIDTGGGRGGGGKSKRRSRSGSGEGYGRGVSGLLSHTQHSIGWRGPAQPRIERPEPVARESYTHHGTNRFTDPTEDRFSTFSIDVDTGSYTIARRKLNDGGMPPTASVRVEEFVNYFSYDYPKPQADAFRVSMEAAPSPFATDGRTHLLRVGVQGQTIASADRKPVHLTFLVDVSGSMQRPDKIGLVKKSLRILTDNLKEGDTVAMATYAGRTEILLQPTRAKGQIIDAIERLSAGGSTAMASGLDLAYTLAAKNLEADHENRVIVLSDGDANVGRTGWKEMLDQISSQVKLGVTLSTIGFGMGNYQDSTMEQLANKGNGNYYYVDSEKEAFKIFGDQIDGTLQVIAKDVKLQVEFNPEAVRRYRLVGYENRDIADKDFRNDKVDAGEIGAGHTVTALYEVELKDELPERIATVRVRHKEPRGSDTAREQRFGFDRDELRTSISKSSADFQFAAAVAAFAEKLRDSPYAKKLTYAWILEIAEGATKGKSDRKEFVKLVKRAERA